MKLTGSVVVFGVVKVTGLAVVVNVMKVADSVVVVNNVRMTGLVVVVLLVNVVKVKGLIVVIKCGENTAFLVELQYQYNLSLMVTRYLLCEIFSQVLAIELS